MTKAKQRHQERMHFYEHAIITCTHNGKSSSYYTLQYNNTTIKFCISDHHGAYRGKLFTVISKSRTPKKVKATAWGIYEANKHLHIR